jgi:hypothetical protein
MGRHLECGSVNKLKTVKIKVEYGQLDEMTPAFGAPGLGTALVVISGFYRLLVQDTRVSFLSIIAMISKWSTKAVPNYRIPKATPI